MIIRGDCLEKLATLGDNSVDAVVTDPPYGLKFMGKKWDYDVPKKEVWQEVLRVLKPGGHLLSFGGTRTYHRLACAVEDAGFEIRDQIQWLYGSGFPKSLDISKAIDKMHGAEREVVGAGKYSGRGRVTKSNVSMCVSESADDVITTPSTDDAKQWQGFGTALKPANEPIVLARKPLSEKTVALNVLKWGTGGLNIDGSRIAGEKRSPEFKDPKSELGYHGGSSNKNLVNWDNTQGRFPANILLDEEAAQMLDEQSGQFKGEIGRPNRKSAGNYEASNYKVGVVTETGVKDFGGASRFFYVAKASKRERNAGLEGMPEKMTGMSGGAQSQGEGYSEGQGIGLNRVTPKQNFHPTVKPIKLMQYLIKLITPPGGVVLDPFMGSGSTGVAAKSLGFDFIGIELNEEYCEIAEKRMAFDTQYK